jgi:hypothetical protein
MFSSQRVIIQTVEWVGDALRSPLMEIEQTSIDGDRTDKDK